MKYLKNFENITKRLKETEKRLKSSMNILTKEEAIDYIINHCSEWLNNPVKIIRGINNNYKYFQSEPVKRFSRDNYNFYNLIMDNSPAWKNYPKRNNSFSCSLLKHHIGIYDYIVIPEDNAKWGVAPSNDIYYSFKQLKKITHSPISIKEFFNIIKRRAKEYNIELNDTNYNEFRKGIKEFQKKSISFGYFYFNKNKDWWRIILEILNPNKNGFKLMSTPQLYNSVIKNEITENLEIWTDSSCVFIEEEYIKDFFFSLNKEVNSKKLINFNI